MRGGPPRMNLTLPPPQAGRPPQPSADLLVPAPRGQEGAQKRIRVLPPGRGAEGFERRVAELERRLDELQREVRRRDKPKRDDGK